MDDEKIKDLDAKLKYMGFFAVKMALLLNVFSIGYLLLFQNFKHFAVLFILSLVFYYLSYLLGITKDDYKDIIFN